METTNVISAEINVVVYACNLSREFARVFPATDLQFGITSIMKTCGSDGKNNFNVGYANFSKCNAYVLSLLPC